MSSQASTQRPASLEDATEAAERIVTAALEGNSFEVHALLRDSGTDVLATVMVLASAAATAVPTGSTLSEVLTWGLHPGVESSPDGAIIRKVLHPKESEWTAEELAAAHAAFNRGERDPWSRCGEGVFQRRRHQELKNAAATPAKSVRHSRVLHHDEADWTPEELRAAHTAYRRGDRDLATCEGERVHERLRGRRRRAAKQRRQDAPPEAMAS